MHINSENDLLETTLALAEGGYAEAYQFLTETYEKSPERYGPQVLYFLSCLAGGLGRCEEAFVWLRRAILHNGWWYRPEALDDEDFHLIKNHPDFIRLKSLSDARYATAVSTAKAVFSWEKKTAEKLFVAIHGNTQNAQTARKDWQPILRGNERWQLETVQSAEPDGFGTYRWRYDRVSYLPIAHALQAMQYEKYQKIACGGFSAGCDMVLRTMTFSPVSCDLLVLQSPWLPILEDDADALICALRQKKPALRIFCGADDADCLPMAQQLYAWTNQAGLNTQLVVQEDTRHQFPAELYALDDLI